MRHRDGRPRPAGRGRRPIDHTDEGDPVVTYFCTDPGNPGIELWNDATQDAFGSGDRDHIRCQGGTGVDDLHECEDV